MLNTKETPSNLKMYCLEKIIVMDEELKQYNYVLVDTLEPIAIGNYVLGVKDGKTTAWKYSEKDNDCRNILRITHSYNYRSL